MTDELFEIEAVPSPRLRWMQRHGIRVEFIPPVPCIKFPGYWQAWQESAPCGNGAFDIYPAASSAGEVDAVTKLSKRLELRLWNEEGL